MTSIYEESNISSSQALDIDQFEQLLIKYLSKTFKGKRNIQDVAKIIHQQSGQVLTQLELEVIDWLLILSMITNGSAKERTLLNWVILDVDTDNHINLEQFEHYIKHVTSSGWCYDKKMYQEVKGKFSSNFKRRDAHELAKDFMQKYGTDNTMTWEQFATLPLHLI